MKGYYQTMSLADKNSLSKGKKYEVVKTSHRDELIENQLSRAENITQWESN